ncbi:MAG: cytochrome c biogenesis protein CcdA [Candidatus Levybacteria bacterium]|nr:cytochrome c biogenesis protein CcdA [Candidatus Levybacteria bacterium]
MDQIFFQTSLIAAFAAGMVALFAPCCITFLLPAYLGSVFKEKSKILLATLVFGLGIFIVLLPAVLGVSLVSKLLFRYHDTLYILGGIMLFIVALMSFFGIKFPMPRFSQTTKNGKADIISIFLLGIFSGIASACCAPVLVGILTFSLLSPNILGAILIGLMYVLGMVFPLLLISIFLSKKMPSFSAFRKPIASFKIFGKTYFLFLNNLIAAIIFFATSVLTFYLTFTGRLTMGKAEGITLAIQNVGAFVNQYAGGSILLNIIFLGFVIFIIYKIAKRV